MIVIETEHIDPAWAARHQGLYTAADCVYGVHHDKSVRQFRHLWHKDHFLEVIQAVARETREELAACLPRGRELALLDHFASHIMSPLTLALHIEAIRARHPGCGCHVITGDPMVATVHHHRYPEGEVSFHLAPAAPGLKGWLLGRKPWLNRIKPLFFLHQLLLLLRLSPPLLRRPAPGAGEAPELLFLSGSPRYWQTRDDWTMDIHYRGTFDRLRRAGFRVAALIRDGRGTMAGLEEHRLGGHLTPGERVRLLFRVARQLLRLVRLAPAAWLMEESVLADKLFLHQALILLLRRWRPRGVIYYDETYPFGRAIALACRAAGVTAYGYQHSFDSEFHTLKPLFRLREPFPELFSHRRFVFGPMSRAFYAGLGYPWEEMIPLGYEQMFGASPRPAATPSPGGGFVLLLVGHLFWDDLVLVGNVLRELEGCPEVTAVHYRPYPNAPLDPETFARRFPGVVLRDSAREGLEESMAQADGVIAVGSSSLLAKAVLLGKVAVAFRMDGMADPLRCDRWGVQVVDGLEQVDWRLRADPAVAAAELLPQSDIADYFRARFAEEAGPFSAGTVSGRASGG